MWKEFKEFAIKGQVLSLAIGVIIGAGMNKIVDSIVKDLIMPLIAALFGGKIDFSNMFIILGNVPEGVAQTYEALTKAGIPVFAYGNFITIVINFLLLALAIFVMVKIISRTYNRTEESTEVAIKEPSEEVLLLREIRDQLKNK